MKKQVWMFFLTIFFTAFLTSPPTLKAADLHAFIVCDTHAISIGRSVEADFKNILNEIKVICNYTNLKPQVKTFTGRNVDAGFLKAVENFEVGPDDVILFYWSGHGKHYSSQFDQWPVFDFEYDTKVVTHYGVTQKLMSKNARLLISLADCCNTYADWEIYERGVEKRKPNKESYCKLFLLSRGTYMACGATPGEISFGLNGNSYLLGVPAGGFFTNALLEVLHEQTAKNWGIVSWESVFRGMIHRTLEYQLNDIEDPYIYQNPQYEYFP